MVVQVVNANQVVLDTAQAVINMMLLVLKPVIVLVVQLTVYLLVQIMK
jgi:hypothetical protein